MRLILIMMAVCFTFSVNAQQSLITTAGSSHATGSGEISWSLGEVMTASFSVGSHELTQGFQQPGLQVSTLIDNLKNNELEVKAYPNPVRYQLSVDFSEEFDEQLIMELYDLNGKLIIKQPFNGTKEEIDFSNYSTGEYILRVRNDQELFKSFKIIKY